MSRFNAGAPLPSPDFTCAVPDCLFIAGVRPGRDKTYRLEEVPFAAKRLIHNYGHGGAGITMSWGCAVEVHDIIFAASKPGPKNPVAVIGAGVMGLTAASVLQGSGYPVTIYAEEFEKTTSRVAGGQWAPSFVEYDEADPTAVRRFTRILRTAYQLHHARIGCGFGVSERLNYTKEKSQTGSLQKAVNLGVLQQPTKLEHLPFERLNTPGFAYQTLLVEPPIFLAKLKSDLQPHVRFVCRTFNSVDQVHALAEPIIVNCTGYGAKALFNDSNVVPIKGQLVLLKAQPALQYLFSTGETYLFPRHDHVVVGGSHDRGNHSTTPVPAISQKILRMARDVFDGRVPFMGPREAWMFYDK